MAPEPAPPGVRSVALALGLALCAFAGATAPTGQVAAGSGPPAKPAAPPADESLFEFLGADDVGDARWWDYLRKSAPPAKAPPPQPPAQEAGQ